MKNRINKQEMVPCDICGGLNFFQWHDSKYIYFTCRKCGGDQARFPIK